MCFFLNWNLRKPKTILMNPYLCNSKNIEMQNSNLHTYIKAVIKNMPNDWLRLTTHRLDIYNESLAKTEFLQQLESLFKVNNSDSKQLSELPTAFDYIRLGHPLSCVLEWGIAKTYNVSPENVISFDSVTIPIMAVLRKNLLDNQKTQILYQGNLPTSFDTKTLQAIYGYSFELKQFDSDNVESFDGSTVLLSKKEDVWEFEINPSIDFHINWNEKSGSIVFVNGTKNNHFVSEIQHVRRRETIAMTPINTLAVLNQLVGTPTNVETSNFEGNKKAVLESIQEITQTNVPALVGSSGLSMQYAIVMGLIHDAKINSPQKSIKIIVPPNCYGGTNDQARRIAVCDKNIEVLDLPVDGGENMVESIDVVLEKIAKEDAIPFIITEIPTNPRVEVPDLRKLNEVLTKKRLTESGNIAIEPVFILDQTFCPNVHFLGEKEILSSVRTIAYVSGSKFPSGGKCTAGYCTSNQKAKGLMEKIELHLRLCDNEATEHQMEFLAEQIPSMLQRIESAYQNTREFVSFIQEKLPLAKINFVSEELAQKGFTPSVFSLDLPTKGETEEEREAYKRTLNLQLINLMINQIPSESKFCVSYGQLKGCYWTIPATSTQGTTKESDKDYIVRVALSGNMDLEKHKEVFERFVRSV